VDPPDAEELVDGKSLGASQPSYQVFVGHGRHGWHTIRAQFAARRPCGRSRRHGRAEGTLLRGVTPTVQGSRRPKPPRSSMQG
jgi:hypothetical protein